MAQRKNPELDTQHQAILKRMMQQSENKSCADCHGPHPRWASTNLGIFICMSCSGIHRKLGTHISQVRSVTLDTWTPGQISHFTKLGNAKAAQYFEACLPPDFSRPPAADSMRMEAFIRDKYENKRFITVENGGLGGAAGRGPASSSLYSSSAPHSTPRGPSHQGAYDGAMTARPASSASYAARFRDRNGRAVPRPSHQSPFHQQFQQPRVKQDAIQRATILKQIISMGFPSDLALRAVEHSQGDLQRAIDFVLENAADGRGPASKPGTASSTRRPQSPAPDLLDMGDDVPAAAPPAPRPTALPVHKPPAPKKPSHFSDFADFGDFESALPVAKPVAAAKKPAVASVTVRPHAAENAASRQLPLTARVPPSTNATAPPPNPLGALADLYKKGPPRQASPTLSAKSAFAALQPLGAPPSQGPLSPSALFAVSPTASPGKQHGERNAALGMPVIDLKDAMPGLAQLGARRKSSATVRATATTAAAPQNRALGLQNGGMSAPRIDGMPAAGPPPPPPPPIEEVRSFTSSDVPAPPTGPPPSSISAPAVESVTAAPPPEAAPPADVSSQKPSEAGAAADDDVANGADAGDAKEDAAAEEPQEEDPFAALSMMALSSATKKNNAVAKPAALVLNKPAITAVDKAADTKPIATAEVSVQPAVAKSDGGAFDLDDLFG